MIAGFSCEWRFLSFLGFFYHTCLLEDTEIRVFRLPCCLIVQENGLGSSNQRAFSSAFDCLYIIWCYFFSLSIFVLFFVHNFWCVSFDKGNDLLLNPSADAFLFEDWCSSLGLVHLVWQVWSLESLFWLLTFLLGSLNVTLPLFIWINF